MSSSLFLEYFHSLIYGVKAKVCGLNCGPNISYQILAIAIIMLLAFILSGFFRRGLIQLVKSVIPEKSDSVSWEKNLAKIAVPLMATLLLWLSLGITRQNEWDSHLIHLTTNLLSAWVIIRLISLFLLRPPWTWIFSLVIFLIAALDFIGILEPTIKFLDQVGMRVDDKDRISLWSVIKAGIILALLFPFSRWLANFLESRIGKSEKLSAKVQVLLTKLLRTMLYSLTILIALDTVGIDFYLISVFSGAIGLGVGFGLQKLVSNLVCGIIILIDNSIRPGDVIEVGGVYGWIESLHGRFVNVITRDGTSHLIPNENLITNNVVNWSFSGPAVRFKIPVGISYDSNVRLAMQLMVEAAQRFPRVLSDPPPSPRLLEFGDSAIKLELRIWINDPFNGIVNLKSDIQLAIWDSFQEHQIEFPFPQHDLYLKTAPELSVSVQRGATKD
jgi:small-conductance mechanosensitive channel